MLTRLLATLTASAVLASTPTLADRDRHHRHGGDRYYRESYGTVVYRPVYREVYIEPAPVYREVYVEPAPVYAGRSYYYDQPRYEHHHYRGCGHDDDAWKWIGGSILVGAILHEAYH
jgi:hypothetical protein